MAERNPPAWLQGGSHPADLDRMLTRSLVSAPGVADLAHLEVTETLTPSLAVRVAEGRAFVAGSRAPNQGTYHVVSDGPVDLPIGAADAVNPRRDLVVARIRDASYDPVLDDDWTLQVVPGTPAADPVDPATPPDSLLLARVVVAANADEVTDADVTDLRTVARFDRTLLGGYTSGGRVVFTSSGTFLKGNYPGLRAVRYRLVGGGGAGGGSAATAASEYAEAGGGGGGGYVEGIVPVEDLPTSVAVTVGAGGAAASAGSNPGGDGGATSFGSFGTAGGGSGGTGASANSSGAWTSGGGNGGTGSGGDLVVPGDDGGNGRRIPLPVFANDGGGTVLGATARSQGLNTTGRGGRDYGGGSSGSRNSQTGQSAKGSTAGADGIVLVDLLY